jgi:hypothetical protein
LPDSTIAPGGSWPVHEIEEAEGVDRKEEQKALFDFKEIKKEKGKKCAKVVGDSEHYVHGKISNRFGQFHMEGRGKTQVEFFFDTDGSGIIKLKGQGEMRVDMSDASTSGEKAETHESHITFGFKKELK